MTIPEECSPCTYAAEHGWWGPEHKGTHCRVCHKSWGGTTRAHCTVCHETFASDGVAQHHWRKDGHLHPSDVKGFWQDEGGFWHFGTKLPVKPAWMDAGHPSTEKDAAGLKSGTERGIRGDLDPPA